MPRPIPNASLVVEPAVTPGPGVFSFGGYASYAYRPITLRKAGTDDVALRPVEHVLGLDAVANLGIGQRFAIGADIPLILYQDGSRPLPPTVSQVDAAPSSGIGDIGITMKGALVRNEGGGLGHRRARQLHASHRRSRRLRWARARSPPARAYL